MLWEIITFPFRLVGTIFGMVFGFIGNVVGFVFNLAGGIMGVIFGGAFVLLIIIGVLVLIRWLVRGFRGV